MNSLICVVQRIPFILLVIVVSLATACAPRIERVPLAPGEIGLAYGVPGSQNRSNLDVNVVPGPAIAFSGGGQKGAFGAGVMVGWTARGDRPEFAVVTGVSTGAILALFAFLGPEYDKTIKTLYTRHRTRDLLRRNYLSGFLGGSALDSAAPYRALIDLYISDTVIREIADEADKGRKLLIGSTDLDGKAPYLWDVTAIAESGHPDAGWLIRDIVQASSAIPAIFPPVVIPFTDETGQTGDRLHVDGGITRPFVYRPMVGSDGSRNSNIYVVINEFVERRFEVVEPNLRKIATTTTDTFITTSVRDALRLCGEAARRNGIAWKATAVPSNLQISPKQDFDPVYMQALFERGRTLALAGRAFSPGHGFIGSVRTN
tara:strand:- start:1140 stop:2261 length:1122 start_codon:yes stop_codon:yes gene_type:complete